MKTFSRVLSSYLVAGALLGGALRAQTTEPIIAVDITTITVANGSGAVVAVNLLNGGSGYQAAPTVTLAGGGGSGAVLTPVLNNGTITSLTITNGGTGYTTLPTITIQAPGTQATASALVQDGEVSSITLSGGGSGYSSAPTVTITGTGTGATATATIANGAVTAITLGARGTGYGATPPTVTIAAPGTQASAVARTLGTVFSQPFQNESYGAVDVPMTIAAVARGVFPEGGYQYNFFVNGAALGIAVTTVPAGLISWAPPQPGSYLLSVTATGAGHTATSLPVRYFATGTAIIGPVDNSLVPIGSSVILQATATPAPTGPNAFVQRMEFYIDGVLVGTDTTYPYSYIYTPTATPTTHTLEARGFDNNGNQISPSGTATRRLNMVTPIGSPPTVRILNPPTGSSVSSGTTVNLIAEATAPTGFIKNVQFYINGVLMSSTQAFPFTASWTPSVPGRYEFVAIGFDDKSNAVASAPITLMATGAFPTASITSPGAGLTVVQGSTVPVTVTAAGADGGVGSLQKIEFLVDGVVSDTLPRASTGTGTGGTGTGGTGTGGTATGTTAGVLTEPFIFNWRSNVTLGTHRLSVRVTDLNGLAITSPEITVSVIANQPPQVNISAPTASTSVTVNTATNVAVTASDVDGTIASVEFFVDGVSIGSASKAPFQINWTPTTAGTFTLTARATDNGGASAVTNGRSITVDPPAPETPTTTTPTTLGSTVYRGNYGSVSETGGFAFALNRNNRGTFIGFSTAPRGRSYFWSDVPVNADGTFSVRDAAGNVVLSGQTSATGVSGSLEDKTFIGPISIGSANANSLLLTGTVAGVPNSRAVAIVGGDGSVTLYTAAGNSREAGSDFVTATGNYSFAAPTGGQFTGTVANSAAIVSGSVSGSVTGNFLLRQEPGRLTNISTRATAGTGQQTLVAGFVVSGTGTKPLLVRAVGPTLGNFGVSTPLADPTVTITSSTGAIITSNNDWANSAGIAPLSAQVGAFPLTPGSRDAAVQLSVAPGTYSALVGGATTAGTALIEIYDAETTAGTARITNISTRGQVGAGEPMIAGLVITGDSRKRLLIRAVGPTLAAFGVTGALADPRIDVYSGTNVVATNNDWTEVAGLAQVNATTPLAGAFALNANSRDAALVVQLAPGSYTVQVAGVGNSSGTALVEIYDVDQ